MGFAYFLVLEDGGPADPASFTTQELARLLKRMRWARREAALPTPAPPVPLGLDWCLAAPATVGGAAPYIMCDEASSSTSELTER